MMYTTIDSPLGELLLCWDGGLAGVYFPTHKHGRTPTGADQATAAPFADVIRQLGEYFAGRRESFDLPLNPAGTPFQLAVWRELSRIPYGQTSTYGKVGAAIGAAPGAARAIGAAVGRNPISIIVPCHRVLGATGAITGYAGGLPTKQWLLEHEGIEITLPAGNGPVSAQEV